MASPASTTSPSHVLLTSPQSVLFLTEEDRSRVWADPFCGFPRSDDFRANEGEKESAKFYEAKRVRHLPRYFCAYVYVCMFVYVCLFDAFESHTEFCG